MKHTSHFFRPLSTALALILLLTCLLGSLLACQPSDLPDDPDQPDDSTDQPNTPPVDGLILVENGVSHYRIVRGDMESATIISAGVALAGAIENATTVRPSLIDDYTEYDENVKEIIVGLRNTRPAAQGLADSLSIDTFSIQSIDGNILIFGDSDVATAAAADYFIATYLNTPLSSLIVPKDIHVTLSLLEWQTMTYDQTVTLKHSYSDYIDTYQEDVLIAFDDGEVGYGIQYNGWYDSKNTIDSYGALRWDLKGKIENVSKILTNGKDTFLFNASDKNRTTLKFWLYVSDTDAVVCDHDKGYGVQENQATFYFRAVDKNGKTHSWNHTLTNNGWHEVELSFNVHNGVSDNFDYEHITGFWVGLATYDDVTIIIDDLRGVTYQTDYTPDAITGEKNPRLISDCEYDALDGAIVQEWYGASYDKDDKAQGDSSLRCYGDSSVNDYRTIVANLDIPMDYEKDELVFSFKVADPMKLKSVFIELNQVQDSHEYQKTFTLDDLKAYGFTGQRDTWCEIRIPLSAFELNLNEALGTTVTLCNFRFCGTASGSASFDYHIDHIYLAEK